MNYPAWLPSTSLCVRCATSHGMVEDKQCGYETFIKPALMINNIAMFAQKYVTYNYCTAAYTIAMAVCAVQSECFGTSSGTRGRLKTCGTGMKTGSKS